MSFLSRGERRTLAELNRVLAPQGYLISQKIRVKDAVDAAAEHPTVTVPPGSSVVDTGLPAMRAAAGLFGPSHPWLWHGDWSYAYRAHFDFVVHAPLGERLAAHPLFAVEFDGAHHRTDRATIVRDCRKNRLCLASGLPLVRIDESFLHRRDRLSMVAWLAELWTAWRAEMPRMLADRDAEIETLTQQEHDHDPSLLLDRPDLDVRFCFGLAHPYPPIRTFAERLSRQHGLTWPLITPKPPLGRKIRWEANSPWPGALPYLGTADNLAERWVCDVDLRRRPAGPEHHLHAMAEVRAGYPTDPDAPNEDPDQFWSALAEGRFPWLPAGPFGAAPSLIGDAMCTANALNEIGEFLHYQDR